MCEERPPAPVPRDPNLRRRTVMRYGKSTGVHEVDMTRTRAPAQSLKSAAPGAPFGWTNEGKPYEGTQYCIRAQNKTFQFASLSTRNGGRQYYWKSLSEVSRKVALSALETHGSVENLLAGETDLPVHDIFEPMQMAAITAIFQRLVGAETLAAFAAADLKEAPAGAEGSSGTAACTEVKSEAAPEAAATSATKPETTAVSTSAADESRVVGSKRSARMALVDELTEKEAVEKAPAAKRSSKMKQPKEVD